MKKNIKELRMLINQLEKEKYDLRPLNKTVSFEGLIMPIELKNETQGAVENYYADYQKIKNNLLKVKKALREANSKGFKADIWSEEEMCVIDLIEESKLLREERNIVSDFSNLKKNISYNKDNGKQTTTQPTFDVELFKTRLKEIDAKLEKIQLFLDKANLEITVDLTLDV